MAKPIHINLQAGTDDELDNYAKVIDQLSKVETVEALAVLPDACPAGQAPGTIPVGGVAKVRGAIHPGCTRLTCAARWPTPISARSTRASC
ncbi:hypothetical protein NKI82_08780 [Mesorhizobium sp. M0482]|uniref:hypothetical protein n=1 Tax=Mesorhizobium sp. M0482 TaxID=2956948 RepID=UPI00333E1103